MKCNKSIHVSMVITVLRACSYPHPLVLVAYSRALASLFVFQPGSSLLDEIYFRLQVQGSSKLILCFRTF